jgi:hypothetical protein
MVSIFPLPSSREPAFIPLTLSPCRWQVVGAAAAGVSHLKKDLPCQDSQAYRLVKISGVDVLLVAVADGAGSAEHSDQGSACAVEASLLALEDALLAGYLEQMDAPKLLYLAFETARQALIELALQQQISLRSLATTLTLVAAHGGSLLAAQLGDGAVVIQTEQEKLTPVTKPQRGEYANETYFLTQENALEKIAIEIIEEPVQALAVMSDGLMRLAMNMSSGEPHPPFFAPLFAFAAGAKDPTAAAVQLEEFLSSDRVCARTDDDKSLVLAVCQPSLREGKEHRGA